MKNVRHYINSPGIASAEIERIAHLIYSGKVERLVGFDTETMPALGLEAYPTTLKGAIDVTAGKKHYMLWFQWVTARDFDLDVLMDLGCPFPTHMAGKFAKPQWEQFALDVKAKRDSVLNKARRPGAELPVEYWFHCLDQIVEARGQKIDPVRPGLNPQDSQIFAVQFTLRHKATKQLESWVFNTYKIPLELMIPALHLDVTYIGQNIKFDLGQLMYNLGRDHAPRNVFDTMIADRVLTLGMPGQRGLGDLAKKYLDIYVDKEVRSSFIGVRRDELTPEQIDYSFVDTEILFPLYDEITGRARRTKQLPLLEIFSRLSWITALWETEGYVINRTKWLELTATATSRRDEYAAKLEAMLLNRPEVAPVTAEEAEDEDFDPDADESLADMRANAIIKISQTALVAKYAQEMLGLSTEELDADYKSEKTGLMSMSKDARSGIEHYYTKKHGKTHPFFGDYAKWSALAKMASTYGKRFLWNVHPVTGRVHPVFRIAGTDTARYASTSPNFLNLPRGDIGIDVRSAIEAPPGFWIGGADYSAFEMRAAAALSLDPALMKIFANDVDMHSGAAILAFHIRKASAAPERRKVIEDFRVGAMMYQREIWEFPADATNEEMLDFALSKEGLSALLMVPKLNKDGSMKLDEDGNIQFEKPTRQLAKIVNFLIIFGGGAYTLAAKTNIPVEDAERIIESYYAAFPVLIETIRRWEKLPFEDNLKLTKENRRVGYIQGRGNLRRYFPMPTNPSRHRFEAGKEGDEAFEEAQKKFYKQRGAIRRQSFNLGPQGGNAVVTATALLDVVERGLPHNMLPWISVYDEIKVLVPEAMDVSIYQDIIESAMVGAAAQYFPELPFEAKADPLSRVWK
jgi:DNA polymerase I-like protein with 3'-5' exonuclease and polymerase domains